MANINDVTVATLNTTAISADTLKIHGMDIEEYLKNSKATKECTAIEIFPTDVAISAGMVDSNDRNDPNSVACAFNFDNTTATGLTYILSAPASGLEVKIDCYLGKDNLADSAKDEVSIDWGDETVGTYRSFMNDSGQAVHTYATSKKYILKVYGSIACLKLKSTNCTSRIWDTDLPVASTVWNMADIGYNTQKLLRVKVPGYNFKFPKAVNWCQAFKWAYNLQEFSFGNGKCLPFPRVLMMNHFFSSCYNLKTVDWDPENNGRFPEDEACMYNFMYCNCSCLTSSIDKLMPLHATNKMGWNGYQTNTSYMFQNCSSIPMPNAATQERLSAVLWGAQEAGIHRYTSKGMFEGSSLSGIVPEGWK